MVAVEDVGDLLLGPAQPLSQLRLVEPGLAHRAVQLELGSRESRELDRYSAGGVFRGGIALPRRFGDFLPCAMRPSTASSSMSSA
jgi:hypothetical protein